MTYTGSPLLRIDLKILKHLGIEITIAHRKTMTLYPYNFALAIKLFVLLLQNITENSNLFPNKRVYEQLSVKVSKIVYSFA